MIITALSILLTLLKAMLKLAQSILILSPILLILIPRSSDMSTSISVIDEYLTSECSHLCPSDLSTLRSLLVQYHVFVLLSDNICCCDLSPHRSDTNDTSPIKQ